MTTRGALYHGTGRHLDRLEPQWGVCTDVGSTFPIPVLMLTPSRREADYFAGLGDGGCGDVDAPASEHPTVWRVDVESAIVDMTDAELEQWFEAVAAMEPGVDDQPPAAVRCMESTYCAMGTVILAGHAAFTAVPGA